MKIMTEILENVHAPIIASAEKNDVSAAAADGGDVLLRIEVAAPFEFLSELLARLWAQEATLDFDLTGEGKLIFYQACPLAFLGEIQLGEQIYEPFSFKAEAPMLENEELPVAAEAGQAVQKKIKRPLDNFYAVLKHLLNMRRLGDELLSVKISIVESVNWPNPPVALGPWRLTDVGNLRELPPIKADRLFFTQNFSPKFWQNQTLLAQALSDWLNPPPGAPVSRGLPALFLSDFLPLAPLAAVYGGAGAVEIISENEKLALNFLELNQQSSAVKILGSFNKVLKQKLLQDSYAFIGLSLSPFLTARRLKHLALHLAEGGRILITDFVPGSQTAYLLRAAAKCGLILSSSFMLEDQGRIWASMILEKEEWQEKLPAIEGGLVPDLEEVPEEETVLLPDLSALGLEVDEPPDQEEEERQIIAAAEEKILLELEEEALENSGLEEEKE